MSDFQPIPLIRLKGYRRGAELGVWRGAFAERAMRELDLDSLLLVDPWRLDLNRFPTTDRLPARMRAFGEYRCTMGEPYEHTQDDFDAMYAEVVQKCAVYGNRVRILRMTAPEAAEHVPYESLDFVRWDAVQLYPQCFEDLVHWWPKIRPGGAMFGVDFSEDGIQRAVKELLPHALSNPTMWVAYK